MIRIPSTISVMQNWCTASLAQKYLRRKAGKYWKWRRSMWVVTKILANEENDVAIEGKIIVRI